MYNNWDYPAGVDTPDAPWNQVDPPEKDFNIAVSCSLSKDTTITTDDYDGIDENSIVPNEIWNTYTEQEYTVDEIIDFARHCAEYMLNKKDFGLKSKYGLKQVIDSCNGWVVDEENAEQI